MKYYIINTEQDTLVGVFSATELIDKVKEFVSKDLNTEYFDILGVTDALNYIGGYRSDLLVTSCN